MSEDKTKEDDALSRVVTRRRKLFDYAVGAAVPLVLSLSIALINRLDSLESYRDLDEYRMGEFARWKDHGEYRRHYNDTVELAEDLAELSRQFGLCQQRVETLERGWPNGYQRPFSDKGNGR